MTKKLLILFILSATIFSYGNPKEKTTMTWQTKATEHEGFPLLLRKPDYKSIWDLKPKYSKLLCVTHELDKVKPNGLPEEDYNSSLADFDHEMCTLFENDNEGIIFLVETFGGERNYYYYISPTANIDNKLEVIKKGFGISKLTSSSKEDKDWGFLDKYPTKLYDK